MSDPSEFVPFTGAGHVLGGMDSSSSNVPFTGAARVLGGIASSSSSLHPHPGPRQHAGTRELHVNRIMECVNEIDAVRRSLEMHPYAGQAREDIQDFVEQAIMQVSILESVDNASQGEAIVSEVVETFDQLKEDVKLFVPEITISDGEEDTPVEQAPKTEDKAGKPKKVGKAKGKDKGNGKKKKRARETSGDDEQQGKRGLKKPEVSAKQASKAKEKARAKRVLKKPAKQNSLLARVVRARARLTSGKAE